MKYIHELLKSLQTSSMILENLIESIPPERYTQRRRKNFWTIAEHVDHLAEVQPMLLERIERFQEEENPEFVPFIPGDDDPGKKPQDIDIERSLYNFKSSRHKQLALLERVDEDAWGKSGAHPEYEQYSLSILVRHILMHDYWHMYRIEELWLTKDEYLTNLE